MLNEIPIGVLLGLLLILLLLSAFFSASETGIISLNRYRLRHLAKAHSGARKASQLLERPERLIGLILVGNNFANVLASSIATILALRLYGESAVMAASLLLTVLLLLFGEVSPKTLAALHPERIAFPASHVLTPLLRIFYYPLVWPITVLANRLLRLLGVSPDQAASHNLTSEELRTVVNEAGAMIPKRHQQMLLSVLDLEKVTVEDIMVPRNEISGIDIEAPWEDIQKQLATSQHTRLPVFRGSIDNVIGILHLRNVLGMPRSREMGKEELLKLVRDTYFIPEGTELNTQLLNFQHQRRRIGLVINEYGDILGLVTLDDILEEIVGEFTTGPSAESKDIHPQQDGTYLVDGSTNIRELNRIMRWDLPTDGPKTLNGMIIEYLETIPEPGTSLLLAGYPLEVVQSTTSAVKTVRIDPGFKKRGTTRAP
ncbi:MAG TPA: HlyC/CorC family transporter [Gammaproteobacteria bacterium]